MIKTEVDKPKVTKTVVVYSGRFQPFHNGHYATYKHLVNKFGSDSVYIGTSNDTSSPKSPFNFQEKKKIATTMFSIPADKFVLIKNPYQPKEILSKFDGQTTQYVAVVGEKDADRLSGKYFKPYKDKQGYGYDEIGYVYAAPAQPNPISGTDVRNNLGGTDKEKAKDFFTTRAYPKFNQKIFDFITKRLSKISEDINVDVSVGDEVLMGKFKNKKTKVKDIGQDSHGMPTINGKQATTFRKIKTEGFPGGVGVGLNLPSGYINGAPTGSKVDDSNTLEALVNNLINEFDFDGFIKNYLNEAEPNDEKNPIYDKEIDYTNAAGEKKKIKVRSALRLPKDHPAHIEAEKITADIKKSATQTNEPKTGGEPKVKDTEKTGEQKPKETDTQKSPEEKDPQKLSGVELKSDAEERKTKKQKEPSVTHSDPEQQKAHEEYEHEKTHGLSHDEQQAYEFLDNVKPEERQATIEAALNKRSWWEKFSQDTMLGGFLKHKKEQYSHTGQGIASLAAHGRLGVAEECSEGAQGPHAQKRRDDQKKSSEKKASSMNAFTEGIMIENTKQKNNAITNEIINELNEDAEARRKYLQSLGVDGKPKPKEEKPKDRTGCKDSHYEDFMKRDENGKPMYEEGPPEPVYKKGKKPDPSEFLENGNIWSGIGPGGPTSGNDPFKAKELDPKTGYFKRDDKYYDDRGREVNEKGDLLGKDGNPTQATNWLGKPKTRKTKKPVFEDNLSEEQMEAAHRSQHAAHEQHHALVHTGLEIAAIVGSVVAAPLIGAAGKATFGIEASSQAAGHGVADVMKHVAKDYAKHAFHEILGTDIAGATAGGNIATFVTGGALEENIDPELQKNREILTSLILKTLEKMKTYEMTPKQKLMSIRKYKMNKKKKEEERIMNIMNNPQEQKEKEEHYVPATGMFNRTLTPQQKIDKLNPARAIEKSKIWHKTFSHHDPESGELTETKIKNIADFVEYATKRLKLNEKPKVKLITGNNYSETQGSLGAYSDQTKEIYVAIEGRLTADILRTLAHEMAHRKQDELGIIKDVQKDGKTGSPIENKAHIVAGILMREYGKINKTIFQEGYLSEASNISSAGEDDEANGMFLPKGAKRKLGAGDGVNKSDEWFLNGGYIQIEFPEAGQIFGDDEQDIKQVIWKVKNLPRSDFEKTKFNKKNFVKEGTVYGTDNGESFRSPYSPDWKSHDKYGEKHAEIIGYKVAKHNSEIDAKKAAKYIPVQNPNEENGPGKRSIHPSKGTEYYNEKTERWEMYPFNSRPDPYSYPDVWAKPKPVAPIKSLSETFDHRVVSLLTEGGAYGHMAHPFDDMQLTFGDLKNIISGALNGRLELTREKTDGQALAISWKNGRLIAARNKGHLANAGANAMGIEDVASKFAGRGGLSDAYNFAMKDLSAAIAGLSNAQKEKIFSNGKCFMNLEVIWPESVNVIPYGQALLVFHNITCYDDKGTAISGDVEPARILGGMIKQINANVQSKYSIQGPAITTLPKSEELSGKQGKYFAKLNKLQNQFGCKDSDTMAVYHQHWWENFINTKAPVQPDKITRNAIVRRWAFGDKSFKLNTISNPELQKWAIENDKVNVEKQQRDNIRPFEEIFLGVGSEVLQFVTSVLTVHPDKAIRNMKDRLQATAERVKQSNDPKIIEKFKKELERLNKLGGVDKIVAAEGIVFVYNGKTYKLTGTFAPLNQLLGIFYG